MAESPGPYIANITLPIFTRVTPDSELLHLGDVTIDVPIDIKSTLPMETVSEGLQQAVSGLSIDPPTDYPCACPRICYKHGTLGTGTGKAGS